MEKDSSWEAKGHLLTHEIPFHSWNSKFHYHVHKSLPLDLLWAGWVCTYSQVLFPRVILILSSHTNNSKIDNCILIVFGKSNSIVTNIVFLWVIRCKGNESVGMYSMVCVLDWVHHEPARVLEWTYLIYIVAASTLLACRSRRSRLRHCWSRLTIWRSKSLDFRVRLKFSSLIWRR